MDENYTWRKNAELFVPGGFDRIIYSDSVLSVEIAFVLNTMELADGALAALGLDRYDVLLDTKSGTTTIFQSWLTLSSPICRDLPSQGSLRAAPAV